eukprot:6471461-Amphidinium_carterae.2
MVPQVQTYLLPCRDGHHPLSVAANALALCEQRSSASGAKQDMDYHLLQETYVLNGAAFHNASMVVMAERLEMSRSTLETKLIRLAAAYTVYSRMEWTLVLQYLKHCFSTPSLVLFMEVMSYDETPMKAKVLETTTSSSSNCVQAEAEGTAVGSSVKTRLALSLSMTNVSESTKILQCRHSCAMVIRLGCKLVKIHGNVATPLQIMEKNNACILRECLSRVSASTSQSNVFKLQVRVASRDQAAYNKLAERVILHERHPHWTGLEFGCEVHASARAFSKTFDGLLKADISGLLNVALVLRAGANMLLFRRCIQEEILSRLKLKFCQPPQEAQAYREAFLQTCVTVGANVFFHRVVLARLPNGLWSNFASVEMYLPAEWKGKTEPNAVAKVLTSGLCYVLCGVKPHMFQRHRWCGCDLAIEELCRVEGIHGLLSSTWVRFMNTFSKTALRSHLGQATPSGPELGDGGYNLHLEAFEGNAGGKAGGVAEAQDPDAHATDLVLVSGEAERHRTPEQHAQDRVKAAAWLATKPFSTLVLLRVSMVPLTNLLHGQLDMSSEDWERQQQATQAMEVAQGNESFKRQFMVTMAAQNKLESKYMEALQMLFLDPSPWRLVEERKHTVNFRGLGFRVLAMQGSLVHVDLVVPHQLPPFTLFAVLHDPDKASSVRQTEACLLDDWSKHILGEYPSLDGEECREVLWAHAAMASTNIAPIESRHASLRRKLLSRSLHTHTMPVAMLSAEFVLQSCRNLKRHQSVVATSSGGARTGPLKRKSDVQCSVSLRLKDKGNMKRVSKTKNYAGTWRAWVRLQSLGMAGRPSLRSLAASYRSAKAENSADFQKAMALASAVSERQAPSKKCGSFGLNSRKLGKRVGREKSFNMCKSLRSLSLAKKAMHLAQLTQAESLETVRKHARRQMLLEKEQARKDKHCHEQALSDFQNVQGKACLDELRAPLSSMPIKLSELRCQPCIGAPTFEWCNMGSARATKSVSWASAMGSCNVPQSLEREWRAKHETVTEVVAKPAPHLPPHLSKCKLAGYCVCRGSSAKQHQMRNLLIKQMKAIFPDKLKRKELALGKHGLSLQRSELCGASECNAGQHDLWLHISSMSFKPYKPTLMTMRRHVGDEEELADGIVLRRAVLEVKHMHTITIYPRGWNAKYL